MPHLHERVPVIIVEDYDDIARLVAGRIETLIRTRRAAGERAVLGLATGSTPIGIYRELIRLHREKGLDFSNVVTFNLDEYYPMDPGSIHSYHRFMWENLFEHINIPHENIHIPRGDIPRPQVGMHCREYDALIERMGGIDFQILGIGKTGHIGFNEPGSGRESRTRLVHLDTITRKDAAADLFGEENVPREAITMGVATIMGAREIALIATGEHKAMIMKRSVEGEISHEVAATYLQQHPNTTFYVDGAAAGELTRVKTPWLVREVEWSAPLIERAVIWLSNECGAPILKLSGTTYRENHLSSLLARYPSADVLNKAVFARLASKICDNPRLPRERRTIVFSPHPDDDVISMGGMLRKLYENDNIVTVAYMTSGNIAVFDHEVRRYLDFVQRFGRDRTELSGLREPLEDLARRVELALAGKSPGEVDIPEVQDIKREIREAEAVSGVEALGIPRSACRFLNLPFYQTGKVKKDPIGPADIAIIRELFEEVQPEVIFVAGDLSDPHGTHRQCKDAIEKALIEFTGPQPDVWLYRGAWQEWPVHEADVLVPMSQEELRRKIFAIFKHQSQKDTAPFPGAYDEREFWQRVEARNTTTAKDIDRLGLPEYHAMEAFVVKRPDGAPPNVRALPSLSDLMPAPF
ncbi:MAG TPA: glucosamine-6-phosphate deaminase [Longimicrobiales bacterium]|nr:glucosamine-6-phosphate deaminase [Longimicrobiales bacterium]